MTNDLRQITLVFLLKEDKILLAMKKRGFGAGHWNGAGGKPNPGELIKDTARRETKEEIGVTAGKLEKMAIINFFTPMGEESNNQQAVVYFCRDWQGEPMETEEMRPKWFKISDIPYDSMWADDAHWLPEVLKGRKIEADFHFYPDNRVMDFMITDLVKS